MITRLTEIEIANRLATAQMPEIEKLRLAARAGRERAKPFSSTCATCMWTS